MFTVYIHRNKINDKVYVGITGQIPTYRWGADGRGYKTQPLFWRAIEKYGWDNFEHIIVADGLTKETAGQLEQQLIASFNSTNPLFGYNSSIGGELYALGFHHTEESKRKISEAGKLHPPTIYCKEAGNRARRKRVYQYSTDGDLIKIWESIAEAARYIGGSPAIYQCCGGQVKQASGFVWRYEGDAFDKYDTIQRSNEDRKQRIAKCSEGGEIFEIYRSQSEASRMTGISQGNIGACCRGERNKAGGYVWRVI